MGIGSVIAFLLAVALLIIAPAHEASALDTSGFVYGLCNTHSFTTESDFSDGLSTVLQVLQNKSSSASYSCTKACPVMAAYQCRGDISLDSCSQCLQGAVEMALAFCPNAIGSRIQRDGCFVRYENYSFFTEDTTIVVELCNSQKDNSSSFESQVTQLVSDVTSAAPNNTLFFASASLDLAYTGSSSDHLYALAQCMHYLSPADCANCLANISSFWQICDHSVGAQIHAASCYYRFETYPFYLSDP